MIRLFLLFLLALGVAAPGVADAKQLIREFSGTGNRVTAAFQVEGPWIIDWRLDGDYDALIALDVQLIDAVTGRHLGRLFRTKKYRSNGVKLFEEGGRYQLRISSSLARWRFRVEQLTPEEAEAYTIREQPAPEDLLGR